MIALKPSMRTYKEVSVLSRGIWNHSRRVPLTVYLELLIPLYILALKVMWLFLLQFPLQLLGSSHRDRALLPNARRPRNLVLFHFTILISIVSDRNSEQSH